jgi:hypothetical protein
MGLGVLHMLVDDPHITIFQIVLVINMTREALGLHSFFFQGTVNSHHCIEQKE